MLFYSVVLSPLLKRLSIPHRITWRLCQKSVDRTSSCLVGFIHLFLNLLEKKGCCSVRAKDDSGWGSDQLLLQVPNMTGWAQDPVLLEESVITPNTISPPYSQVPHPSIHPTADQRYWGDKLRCFWWLLCSEACNGCIYTEHVQLFSLSLFTKQYSITVIHITLTLYWLL